MITVCGFEGGNIIYGLAELQTRKPSFYGLGQTSFSGILALIVILPLVTALMLLARCIMDNQAMFTAQQMQYKQMYAGIDPTGR